MTGVPRLGGRRWRLLVRRVSLLTVLTLLAIPLGLSPLVLGPGAAAAPVPRSDTQEQARLREAQAAGDLEDSSREVQAAGAELRTVAAELPGAERDVARAKGELAGAQVKLAAADVAVVRAERARTLAEQRVSEAGGRVEQGRLDVGELARRSYQRGRLGALQDVLQAGEPQQVLQRASMLRSVFRYQDGTLERLTRDRLTLARTEADLAADERAVERARETAAQTEARARQITAAAESAAARVASLIASRQRALGVAEANRAQDLRDYQAAQAASRALAERIRRAAAEAAAAEARRQAAAAAARQRAERAGQPAPAPPPRAGGERTGDMLWPAPGRLTSRYGNRKHPIYGDYRFHAGIDIGGGLGARVSAADGGTVTYAGYARGYGTLVVISHGLVGGRDLSTAYAHMGRISVSEGQRVGRGQQVGSVGNEGNSTGPHLHFEVRRNGDPVDPLDYVSPP